MDASIFAIVRSYFLVEKEIAVFAVAFSQNGYRCIIAEEELVRRT